MSFQQNKKTSDLLTMCIKAGRTVKGFDSAVSAVKENKAFCIITAADASEKTIKEAAFVCGKYNVPMIKTGLSKEELGSFTGKQTAVIAVCDKGFADGFLKIAVNGSDNI